MTYLFKTYYSIGKSIIQVNPRGKSSSGRTPNLADICVQNNIKTAVVVDDSMAGIWPIHNTLADTGVGLIFGLRISFVDDAENKSDSSNKSEHKNIVFIKTMEDYKRLIKISSDANTRFFHKIPRVDYRYINDSLSDTMEIAVPFYDSFIFNNLFTLNSCIPNFGKMPVFFLENHDLIYDDILRKSVLSYASNNNCDTEEVCSVYYEKPDDFLAWKVRKLLANKGQRKTLESSNFNNCTSNTFCLCP